MKSAQSQNDEALTSLLYLLKANSRASDPEIGNSQSKQRRSIAPPSDNASRGDTTVASKSLTIDDLRGYFHLPIVEVAKQLGTCTTALKKICRRNKIMKWPYRQIRSITKSIQSLEMASLNDTLPEDLKFQYREQVYELQKAIDDIVQDPNTDVSMHLKENFELEGFDDNETDGAESQYSSKRQFGPSNSVMQIMQAAAATAGYETTSAKSSSNVSNTKRKREEDTIKALKDDPVPEVQPPSIGLTTVGVVAASDPYRNAYFVGPVNLAPLQRKKVKTTKKLVPLIEPDICNHYKMEFLPNSILHHSYKYASNPPDNTIMGGYSQYSPMVSNSPSAEGISGTQSQGVAPISYTASVPAPTQAQQQIHAPVHRMQVPMPQQQPMQPQHMHHSQVQQQQGQPQMLQPQQIQQQQMQHHPVQQQPVQQQQVIHHQVHQQPLHQQHQVMPQHAQHQVHPHQVNQQQMHQVHPHQVQQHVQHHAQQPHIQQHIPEIATTQNPPSGVQQAFVEYGTVNPSVDSGTANYGSYASSYSGNKK